MSSIDFDLHSRILFGLAEVLADSRAKASSHEVDRLISKSPPVPIDNGKSTTAIVTKDQAPNLATMNERSRQTIAALVKYAVRASGEQQMRLLPRLLAYIRHLPAFPWEDVSVLTKELPLPDEITYNLTMGLLEIAFKQSQLYEQVTGVLWSYAAHLIDQLPVDAEHTVTFILPSLAGLSRALQQTPYLCRSSQLLTLYRNMQPLLQDATLEHIRNAITTCLRDHDPSASSRRTLSRYWENGIPLSSNRVVNDLVIILRNVTARVLVGSLATSETNVELSSSKLKKAHLTQTIHQPWSTLLRERRDVHNENDEALTSTLRGIYVISLGYYDDIRKYADKSTEDGKKWALDAYMQEIMGGSLHLAALSSVYLHEVDDTLVNHITACLFDAPQVADAWVHMAALDAAVLLANNFTHLNQSMISVICRFLATPSPVFELKADIGQDTVTMQEFATIRLAQCVQSQLPSQLVQAANSTLYALLNEITRYSEEEEASSTERHRLSDSKARIAGAPDIDQLSEKQKQQVCTNTLSAIVSVAVYLKDDEVMAQALSMLTLRRKGFSTATTISLTGKLVDLALVSPQGVFLDTIQLLATMYRESLLTDNKHLSTSILNALEGIAKRLSKRPEYYGTYLDCLLRLFIDNGNSIQRTMAKSKEPTEFYLASKLGSLLPAIRTLVDHDDFNPHLDPSEETVSLFRNMWFHCVLFGFVTEPIWIREWHDDLLGIAKKTPALVIDSATSYFDSDLEYNSVLRGGKAADHNMTSMRQKLTSFLPSLAYEIKNFSFAQMVFALTVYHIEMMRSRMGDCSFILHYFINDGLNTSMLSNCLETIADRVISAFIKDAAAKASVQTLNSGLTDQVSSLLKLCCHRLQKVHQLAVKTVDRIVTAFPQVFAEKSLITLLLELIQLVWLSCEAEYRDEYCPEFHFSSSHIGMALELGDSYAYRQKICTHLYESAKKWLQLSIDRAPLEVGGLLQDYLADCSRFTADVSSHSVHLGRTLALEIGKSAARNQLSTEFVPKIPGITLDESSLFVNGFTSRRFYIGEISGLEYSAGLRGGFDKLPDQSTGSGLLAQLPLVLETLSQLLEAVKQKQPVSHERLHRILYRAAGYTIALPSMQPSLLRYIVRIPVQLFTPKSLELATSVWNWIMIERADLEKRLMIEIFSMWDWAQKHRKGLFSPLLNVKHPFATKMTYAPSDKVVRENTHRIAHLLFSPHETWIRFLSSRFYAIRHRNKHLVNLFVRTLQETFGNARLMSTHTLAGSPRYQLLQLGLKVLQSVRMEALTEHKFRSLVYDAAFDWFSNPPKWHYGANKSLALREIKLLNDLLTAVSKDTPNLGYLVTSSPPKQSSSKTAAGIYMFLDNKTKDDVMRQYQLAKKLLMLFMESELTRLSVWCNPLNAVGQGQPISFTGNTERAMVTEDQWKEIVRFAWEMSPRLAVQMEARFVVPIVHRELHRLIANNTLDVVDIPEALVILLGERILSTAKLDLKHLQYWAPVPAITATNYFLPAYNNHPLILQYAMRSLEYYPVETVFFYIPQIVQALRYDELGYVEKYIMEAGQVSQLFAHQIIWNMQANFFIDADKECIKPDPLKPTLERIIENLVGSFTGADRAFYEREFKFFGEVTAISGYLKEYIKYGQNEKKPLQKKRLDEELAKIKVDVGVYLPSNPDGKVVDIHRTSGRPLQSHAKAPFMATFKIEKQVEKDHLEQHLIKKKTDHDADEDEEEETRSLCTTQVWQAAIFKVGDDCRQDVLALQLIAVFKNIFTSIGLDLYVYPYRVVATAPGRGVIDVIPQSISRDQLGREKVNSLYDYFVAKYGGPDSIAFQRARTNFVQSVAAYSVISYLLQIKDRHNGNIMLDDDGHIIHIDFGFIFDIAPGGITFESSPFKLTAEMIQVMGGHAQEQAFKQFSELVIKAYLAARPYADVIMQLVTLMLQSGLPCFKGDTIKRMRTRFQLDKSERVAADFMMMRIKDSFENQRTVLYDYFQKLTNGIPY
ncbi:uncharacterized protein BYT42DRAFT_514723 [Radiomyces spectabilis]|uniref:uncharacterized protein n=1 Tax=Radiomyces spectabilis TaxID=64574 RepID=UPI00221FD4F0|nr:uncharacterized protein BYT42DRAFT_514723 [Radiomyces spectabilis]KAI8379424.1 hypothetical protein BYT42DRAFT_514723 [Radiomyces spectabilis]